MKRTTSQFDGLGLGIDLDRLRRRRDLRVLPVCALVGIVLLMGVLYLFVPKGKEEAPKPLSTKFIKRRPQMMRPLTMRKRPQPVVRPLKREKFVSEVPRAVVDRAGVSGLAGGLKVLESVIAHPKVQLERRVPFRKVQVGPTIEVGEIRIARHAKDRVDLSLEMMDIESLDTGRYRGLVVIDPRDKRKVKGFLKLTSVFVESMQETQEWDRLRQFTNSREDLNAQALRNLAETMNEHTGVRTQVIDAMALEDARLMEVPFVLITAHRAFTWTEAEARQLGRYLLSGGFAYIEDTGQSSTTSHLHASFASVPPLRAFLEAALASQGLLRQKDWTFQRLEQDHPLYHCLLDFSGIPRGYWEQRGDHPVKEWEGVRVGDRWIAIYSQKDYRDCWAERKEYGRMYVQRHLQLGVNLLVFALTQEGGIAKRMVMGGG